MSVGRFLKIYGILALVYFVLAFTIGNKSVVGGFITLSLTALIVSVLASMLMLNEAKLRWIVIGTFFIKIVIGIAHYLFFFNADYFSGDGEILRIFQSDFTSYFDYVNGLSESKVSHGLFYFDDSVQKVTHVELLNVLAMFMYKYGIHAMNILPLNCLFSSLAALNIYICLQKIETFKEKKTGLLWLLTLFPLFLDNAIFVRDITGQFLMSIGLTCFVISSNRYKLLWIVPASYLFYMQRVGYVFVPFIAYVIDAAVNKKSSKNLLYLPVVLIVAFYFISGVGGVEEDLALRTGGDGVAGGTSLLLLPIRVVFGIIGPFPWTQFIVKGLVDPAYASQLYNYIAGVIHVGCLIMLFSSAETFKRLLKNQVFMVGLIIVGMGILDGAMHITYIMAGTCFMVPAIYLAYSRQLFSKSMRISFIILLFLNVFVIATGGGFMSLFGV
jgi:hypothetical protein